MDKHDTEQINNVQKYVDDVKKTGDKTEGSIDTDKTSVTANGNAWTLRTPMALAEAVNKTDTNIFPRQHTAVGKDELEPVC